MKLTVKDLDRLENNGIGGLTTYDEQMALINLAREALKTRQLTNIAPDVCEYPWYCGCIDRDNCECKPPF